MTTPKDGSSQHVMTRTPSQALKHPDAGLKDLNHYQRRLPAWRYYIRKVLIPRLRLETPSLARIQSACRTSFLDSYFAMTANLGTHTFFMAALPVCFWCGYANLGIALVHMLALGVYWSGCIKDMLCLPRPLSPPLQRITMSGSAALEYGFPSTHTTNAVSVAVFCLYELHRAKDDITPGLYLALRVLGYVYAFSISLGRIYCGMHGYMDVIAGALLGALIAWLRIAYGAVFDQWILDSSFLQILITSALLLLAVGVHPEPADNCPCFDDSVAFIGVILGIEIGSRNWSRWHAALGAADMEALYTHPNGSVALAVARVISGIAIVFVWRAAMKPIMLTSLPPIFRFVDYWGFRLPRRYFMQSRDYGQVPTLPKDDNVLPPASRIPGMLTTTLRNPRKRTVSIGPQSEADVREHIANREQRRRDSRSGRTGNSRSPQGRISNVNGALSLKDMSDAAIADDPRLRSGFLAGEAVSTPTVLLTPADAKGDPFEEIDDEKNDEQENQKMFDAMQQPRVRYDVEVITKLVVYAGIGWLSVDGNPRLFKLFGIW